MGKHARFGQPKAPNKTHTPRDKKEVRQQQINEATLHSFLTQLEERKTQQQKLIEPRKKALAINDGAKKQAEAIPGAYEESKEGAKANQVRENDAKFISEISKSLPKPSLKSRPRTMRRDISMLHGNPIILKGAYLLILKKIKAEYDNASMFVQAAAWISSSVNNVENSKLFGLVRDGLGGKGTVISEDQQIEWLQALQTHMAIPNVQEQLRVAGVDVVAMAELVEQQLEELQPRIAATI